MRSIVALAVVLGVAAASSAQVTLTQSFPIDTSILEEIGTPRTSFSGATFFVDKFNPALGRLRAITISIYGNAWVNTPLEHTQAVPVVGLLTVNASLAARFELGSGTFADLPPVIGSNSRTVTVPAARDTLHQNYQELYRVVRIENTPANVSTIAALTGRGNFVFELQNRNVHVIPALTNISRDIRPMFGLFGRFRGLVRISYTYVP
jgi:hypothetical protein